MSKRVYNCIIFAPDEQKTNGGYTKYRKVNSIEKFKQFADKKYPNWLWINVYDNSTKERLETIKSKNRI